MTIRDFVLLAGAFIGAHADTDACTAMIAGRGATIDGSTMTTHTDDCFNCDFRLVPVAAADHAPGTMRPVYPVGMSYPRYVGKSRGPAFERQNMDPDENRWSDTEAIGSIPQVAHTYAYLDGDYAIMNEHQLAFGESTCGGKLINFPAHDGGKALFDLSALTRVAVERCKTARCAIELMGDLAVKHGFYGTIWTGDAAHGEAGEALTVIDTQEAWVFHITPDGTNSSAVWVAQRVPDDHITVVANDFIIGEVNLDDTENFMGSANLYSVAQAAGLWDPATTFNFRSVYAVAGSPATVPYFGRRRWRVMDTAAPSIHLDSGGFDYPFSVKVDAKLGPETFLALNRDHYEGTDFDLTKGLAAGPYGNPNRFDRRPTPGVTAERLAEGFFERAISMFRTSYSFVAQSRAWLPDEIGGRIMYGQAAPHATCYTPFYGAATRVPNSYSTGSLWKFDGSKSYWTFSLIAQWMERYYLWILPDVQKQQREMESSAFANANTVEKQAMELIKDDKRDAAVELLTMFGEGTAEQVLSVWRDMFGSLAMKFHDGLRTDKQGMIFEESVTKMWYPKWWLEAVGFWKDSDKICTEYLTNESGPQTAVFADLLEVNKHYFDVSTPYVSLGCAAALVILALVLGLSAGHALAMRSTNSKAHVTGVDVSAGDAAVVSSNDTPRWGLPVWRRDDASSYGSIPERNDKQSVHLRSAPHDGGYQLP